MSQHPTRHGGGLLFKNFKKKQPNHPDYTGTCEIKGVKLEISAWIKDLKSGKGKFMSLAFSEPRERSNNGLPSAEGEARQPSSSEPAPHAAEQHTTEPQQENFVV